MRTEAEQKQIIAMMFMEMFLDGDERGNALIEAAHSYVQSSVIGAAIVEELKDDN